MSTPTVNPISPGILDIPIDCIPKVYKKSGRSGKLL